jgi:hypothetical protein
MRRPAGPLVLLVVLVVLVLLVGACTTGVADDGPGAGDDGTQASGPGATTESPAEPQPPDDSVPERERVAPPQAAGPVACDEVTAAAIDVVIGRQLAAFAADDYETALGFASTDFRAGIDVRAFQALIERDYGLVAEAAGHRSEQCRRSPGPTAQVLVVVTGVDGRRGELVYLMVVEDGQWRVAGASTLREREGTVA